MALTDKLKAIADAIRTKTATRTIYVSQYANPDEFANGEEYTTSPFYRIVADEGKTLTNGDLTSTIIDADSPDNWTEIDLVDEPEEAV